MNDAAEQDHLLGRLMQAAQDGDTAAYDGLLHAIAPKLRRAVSRTHGRMHPSDVEDVVQDILVSVHVSRATYDPDRPFVPWLMAIARNRTADAARRHIRKARHEEAGENLPETFDPSETNTVLESTEDAEALRRAVSKLPAQQRRAIELTKLQELTLSEASAVSGMSIAALKVAVHRGLGALRKALGTKA
jgi:RNA polymerase sigma-70 factor (ECF subfamily)